MLFPKPPRPVGRRRAVAEMIVAYKQAAPIVVGHVYQVPCAEPVPPVGAPAAAKSQVDVPAPPLSQSDHDTPV